MKLKFRLIFAAFLLFVTLFTSARNDVKGRSLNNNPLPAITTPVNLSDPIKKDIAMQLIASAENSNLDWKSNYAYIEDIDDGRGYTAGIIGFTSGTSDMLAVVRRYKELVPGNNLEQYLPTLEEINDSDDTEPLGIEFKDDWVSAANDPKFREAQDWIMDNWYFNPAVQLAESDKLGTLGQFIYFDAMVMHGNGRAFAEMRNRAIEKTKTPALDDSTGEAAVKVEVDYLNAFLDARREFMESETDHLGNIDRIDTEQRVFLDNGNLNLEVPLSWRVNEKNFEIPQ